MTIPVLYCDMDGTIVDLMTGLLQLHQRSIPYEDIRWDVAGQLGIEPRDFWAPCGRDFWANLHWMPDGTRIIAACELIFGSNIALLTSPILTDGCRDGKADWVRQHLPDYERRLFTGSAKHLMAGPGKILLDDSDANVYEFRKAGGCAVLLPRPWNERRDTCKLGVTLGDVLGELQEYARKMGVQ